MLTLIQEDRDLNISGEANDKKTSPILKCASNFGKKIQLGPLQSSLLTNLIRLKSSPFL